MSVTTKATVTENKPLRGLLSVLAIIAALAGAVVIFDAQLVFWVLPVPQEAFAHSMITLLVQDLGALMIGFAMLLYAASRDPVRYITVINAFIVVLVLFAGVDVYAAEKLHFGAIYPGYMIWGRVAFRLVLAIILLSLRPRVVQ